MLPSSLRDIVVGEAQQRRLPAVPQAHPEAVFFGRKNRGVGGYAGEDHHDPSPLRNTKVAELDSTP